MKQIFTLFVTGMLCLFTIAGNAQFSQNFDTNGSYTSNCWTFDGFFWSNSSSDVINGTGSLYTNPPTNSSGSRDVYTPYLNISNTAFAVSFNYKLSSILNGQAIRRIEVGLMDRNNVFTSLDIITMNRNTPNLTQTNTYSQTFNLASPTVQRLVLRFSGDQGDGNTRMIVDDLLVNANANYGPSTTCNSAPSAVDDTYYASALGSYTGTTVLSNDSDPNGETLTASMVVTSPDGNIVLNPDGTFTFTPYAGFTRSFTTFTYRATDNGYNILSTNATVTIYFPTQTLPLTLVQFTGSVSGGKATLNWSVAENESGNYFELQKSAAGKVFESAGLFFATTTTGTEQYTFSDAASGADVVYYRLKLVDKNGKIQFSNTVALRNRTAATPAALTLLQNPVQQAVTASYLSTANEAAQLTIYNTMGMQVYSTKVMLQKGTNKLNINLAGSFASGNYILEVRSRSGNSTAQFIKQ
jgi:hypothetical protein